MFNCGFAVTSFVVVMYDWGEHDNIKELLMAYKYFQHLHSAKRCVDAMTEIVISLRMVLKVELVWVSRVSCQRNTLENTHNSRGNAGP
jgi:hypothetical protein